MNVSTIVDRIDNFRMRNHSADNNIAKNRIEENRKDPVEPDKSDVINILKKLNSSLENIQEKVTFTYHEVNKRLIIKVINNETKEIVREIPNKDIVKLSEHLQEYIGMIVDESR